LEAEVSEIDDRAVGELLDRQAIREAVLRYCRGVDRADPGIIGSAYHSDAFDDHGGATFFGKDIGPGVLKLVSRARCSMNHVTNQVIQFHDPDHAGSESYFTVWHSIVHEGQDRIVRASGRYLDRMERRGGEWRIAHRQVIVEIAGLLPPAAGVTPSRPGLGCRDRTDPSYEVLPDSGA
jgi:SnoaL-like domain